MQSQGDRRLIDLATSVADGASVDWAREAAATVTDADRALIDGLRLLERIAEVHTGTAPVAGEALNFLTHPTEWGALRIIDVVGRGSSGVVYRAWDARLQRHVAVKILEPRGHAHPTETLSGSEIVSEGRLLARVRHPNVVTVYGADEINARVGIWMELVEGRTLSEDVLERGRLTPAELQSVAEEVAAALGAVHRAGLVHRDVKAQNVMRDHSGRIVLMDFGTGIDTSADANVASLAGTPLYLAPEVAAGGAATPRSDTYALGVLLFHLATGKFPVVGQTLREIRRAHERVERQGLASLRPDLPRAFTRIVDRALAPVPAVRFSDASAMEAALRAARERPSRRRRAFALAGAMLLVALAGALAVWSFTAGRASLSAPGLTWTQLPADFLQIANLRGPAVDGEWAPCTSPWGSRNVALCNVVSHEVRVLRTSTRPSDVGQPPGRSLLSPDGRRLAYVWVGEPASSTATLNVIDADGTNAHVLFQSDTDLLIDGWTTDGRALVIRTSMGRRDHRAILVPYGPGAPREMVRLQASDRRTALSPDGRVLVIERAAGPSNADLVGLDISSGSEIWRFDRLTNDVSPVWEPDGRGIVFVSNPNGCRQIVRLAVTDGMREAPTKLHEVGPQNADLYGFGAGGTLFVRLLDRDRNTFVAPIDLAGPTLGSPLSLLADCSSSITGGDWSPNGRQIALVRGAPLPEFSMDVVVTDRWGTVEQSHRVPGTWLGRSEARWSPDSRFLAVNHALARDRSVSVLSVIDLQKSGAVRELAQSASGPPLRRPRWDSTGRVLFFQHVSIHRADLQSTGPPEVHRSTSDDRRKDALQTEAGFDVASDGSMVFGIAAPDQSLDCRLRIVEADGRVTDRHVFQNQRCHGIAWNRSASRLLAATITSGGPVVSSLWLLDRHGGPPVLVAADTRPFWDLSLSPDDGRLLYTLGAGAPSWGMLSGIGGQPPSAAARSDATIK